MVLDLGYFLGTLVNKSVSKLATKTFIAVVSVHFYAIPILHFKFPKFFIYFYITILEEA